MPRRLAPLLLALALTACAADKAKPVATTPPPESAPVVAEVVPEAKFEPVSQAVIDAAVAAVTPDEPTTAPEPAIDDNPALLMDLDGPGLEALLGIPSFSRQETGARVWQYAGTACILDIYLYNDGPNTPYRVTYFEVRGDAAERLCFRNLLLARLAS